jgi:hypothetical protein
LPPNLSEQTTATRITATTITHTYVVVVNDPTNPNWSANLEPANVRVALNALVPLKFPGNLEILSMNLSYLFLPNFLGALK